MSDPLEIMGEIERRNGPSATECIVTPGEWVALRTAIEAQFDALEFAERRSRQPSESQNEWFERLADEFYCRHGFLPPGKSEPMEMAISISGDERRAKWEAFLNEPTEARRKALNKLEGRASQ